MKKLLGIVVLGLILSGNAYAKNLNLILDCKNPKTDYYNIFIHIKNNKAFIGASEEFSETLIKENHIIIEISSTAGVKINRYTLDYDLWDNNTRIKGTCTKKRKKIF